MSESNAVSVLVPLKAEYVGIIRLTASGMASKAGFDIDTIEDIKVAISEVINKIIDKKLDSHRLRIDFIFLDNGIRIDFGLQDKKDVELFANDDDSFSFAIISSLMDTLLLNPSGDILLSLTKKLEGAIS